MENDRNNLLSNDLYIDPIGYSHLKETALWAKFLAIVGFVFSILLIVAGFFAGAFLSTLSSGTSPAAPPMSAGLVSGVYITGGVIYFLICLYLFRFAVKMKVALTTSDQESLNNSFLNLKVVYRILGIIMAVYLGLMILALIAFIGMASIN
jgi:hypothetical protein